MITQKLEKLLELVKKLERKLDDCEWDVRFERTYSTNVQDAKRLLKELKKEIEVD